MRANPRTGTRPEQLLRAALHREGLRFRKDHPVITPTRRVRPDIVFSRPRVAVFVDGCFWHRCPQHGKIPKANSDYWQPKLQRNVERDLAVNDALGAAGWKVVRIWEHELLQVAVSKVRAALEVPADASPPPEKHA